MCTLSLFLSLSDTFTVTPSCSFLFSLALSPYFSLPSHPRTCTRALSVAIALALAHARARAFPLSLLLSFACALSQSFLSALSLALFRTRALSVYLHAGASGAGSRLHGPHCKLFDYIMRIGVYVCLCVFVCVLQCAAVCCSVVQCAAVCCSVYSVLQRVCTFLQ